MKKSNSNKKMKLREIHIESCLNNTRTRKHLYMTEMIYKNGYWAKAHKRYSYYVREKIGPVISDKLVTEWPSKSNRLLHQKPHHVSVRRIFDHETGTGKTSCRTTGSFYATKKDRVFAVVFMHSVKFDLIGPSLK